MWLKHLTANAKVTTVLGTIPASSSSGFLKNVTHKERLRPMRMLIVPRGCQNYQNGAVNNQLTDFEGGECIGGGSESVDV